ncbi:sulfatase family protein [Pseudomonas sp.]|uniref:sulfatase family protein n=1 Tax=Pseudomonas sp. TaxID=306 RepID=UPI002BC1291D|nr:sulfatase-like hydrolase/transferase [Pseudomonas sp.]HUE92492.1 sulfatase-like hydrolase/transferase [Pseudomonas sp.]
MSATLRTILCGLSLLAILLTSGCSGNDSDQQPRPNILLILTDDLGNNDIASWGDGTAPTPTLDELSRQSVRFRRHFTDSTCSPSRAALLTGQHPISVGFQADGLGLSQDLETLPEALQGLGYRTAHVGKWHVGEALEYPEIQPGYHGFDYWFGMLNHFVLRGPGPDGSILRQQPTHIDPWLQDNGMPPRQYQGYLDDLLTDKAIDLMVDSEQPWFINLWLFSPHTPYQPSPRFANQFPDTAEGQFQSILKHIDFNVERLLASLERKGLAENTIVVFASDNGGPNITQDNNFPFIGKKATYLEGGVRSPLWLRWPGHYEDAEITAATHITDIYPTLLALAGGESSENIMGRNLRPLMDGKVLPEPAAFYWMANGGGLNMSFAAYLFDQSRLFYRDMFGGFQMGPITPALGSPPDQSGGSGEVMDRASANDLIKIAERNLRWLPLNWQPGGVNQPASLSGRDFQRAPAFGGFSMGLSLDIKKLHAAQQTLLEQEGVWRVDWLPDQRLRVLIGSEEQLSIPISQLNQACNSLMVTTHIKPLNTFPFPGPAASTLRVYWNNQVVLDSDRILTRPATAKLLKNPTWIGNSADGKHPFLGKLLGKPIVINKLLLREQPGYSLEDLQQALCSGAM